jgi:2-phospho-L-lactate guanylyltransferase
MMTVIPAKPLRQAKSRLALVLTVEQRMALSRRLLRRTVHLAQQAGPVVVISSDPVVRKLAKQAGAWALVEQPRGLNPAVAQAACWVAAQGGESVLILPADLPCLTATDLQNISELGQLSPAVVVAPCRRESGTNALLLSPPTVISPAFGLNSFQHHLAAAELAGLTPVVYRSYSVGFDIDLPEDLQLLKNQPELFSG